MSDPRAPHVVPAEILAELGPADVRTVRLYQVVITGVGLVLLAGTAFFGAVLQAGVTLCAVCLGRACGPGVQICPGSVLLLAIVVAVLLLESALVAVGLSMRAVARGTIRMGVYGVGRANRVKPDPPLSFLAPMFLFFGWSLAALGLMLPLDNFGQCIEPCDYPWVLSGYPELLVVLGVGLLATGAAIFGLISLRRRRA
jgi:hypothetical protein